MFAPAEAPTSICWKYLEKYSPSTVNAEITAVLKILIKGHPDQTRPPSFSIIFLSFPGFLVSVALMN